MSNAIFQIVIFIHTLFIKVFIFILLYGICPPLEKIWGTVIYIEILKFTLLYLPIIYQVLFLTFYFFYNAFNVILGFYMAATYLSFFLGFFRFILLVSFNHFSTRITIETAVNLFANAPFKNTKAQKYFEKHYMRIGYKEFTYYGPKHPLIYVDIFVSPKPLIYYSAYAEDEAPESWSYYDALINKPPHYLDSPVSFLNITITGFKIIIWFFAVFVGSPLHIFYIFFLTLFFCEACIPYQVDPLVLPEFLQYTFEDYMPPVYFKNIEHSSPEFEQASYYLFPKGIFNHKWT